MTSWAMDTAIRIIRICAVAMVATTLLASSAWATATLHIGPGANTTCATGGCPIFIGGALDGEVNNIEPTQLDIYQNSNGAPKLNNPVLLILSVPNNVSAPSALSASLYAPYPEPSLTSVTITAGTNAYGIKTDASGFAGSMTSGDVYGFLGLSGANNSNSFTNYSAAYLRVLGTSVSSFGIYLFSIDTAGFGSNDLLDIMLSGLPEGTFAIGYGQAGTKAYATPFTQAGMVDNPVTPEPVPEPGSLAVFGAALVALGLLRWRKRSLI
jgi:PEP-CTERM motif